MFTCSECDALSPVQAKRCPTCSAIRPTWTAVQVEEPGCNPDDSNPDDSSPDDSNDAGDAVATRACPRCSTVSPSDQGRCLACGTPLDASEHGTDDRAGIDTDAHVAIAPIIQPPAGDEQPLPVRRPNSTKTVRVVLEPPHGASAVIIPAGQKVSFCRNPGASPLGTELLNFPNVSRVHAELHFDGSVCKVRDRNSTNGTFLIGEHGRDRLLAEQWYPLPAGRTVQLGADPERPNARLIITIIESFDGADEQAPG